ncbi:MAG: alpha/beta fold hydrolase [Maioricimonas sp. JB049]
MPAPELLIDGPADADWMIALAHGAGAGMESDFMTFFAEHLAHAGLRVVRFEFPYMQQRRTSGKKSPPNREPVLRETWLSVVEKLGPDNLVIGGKSMGGRIASLVADEAGVAGLVCLGYPFHPAGKPDRLRVEHLRELSTPALILQGERDTFGNRQDVPGYGLPARIRIEWLPDGDHSFKPRKASGHTLEQNRTAAVESIVQFVGGLG